MIKIYLALGHKDLENFIKKYKKLLESGLHDTVEFDGQVVYREAALQGVKDIKPDIILLRESLQGDMSISDLIYNIKIESSKTRIILLTGDRAIGDPFLASLVNMGVYDFLIGNKVDTKALLKNIVQPREFSEVAMYAPKATVNEDTNKVSYEESPTKIPKKIETFEEKQFEKQIEKSTKPKPVKIDTINPIEKEKTKPRRSLFGKKIEQKTINQQIITFVGGSEGVGNSHIAFNTAINLANEGFNILYMDLNNKHAAMDTIFQLGYEDIGLDKALEATDTEDIDTIRKCIGTIPKALSVISKKDYLYNTYVKLPTTLSFMFFSQLCMNGEVNVIASLPKFRQLMKILLRDFHFDVIILDAPSNMRNPLTQMAIMYAEKLFFTVTQDNSVIASLIKGTRVLDNKNVNFRNKMNLIINKFEKCDFSMKNVYQLITGNIDYDSFSVYCIPNLNREFITSSFNAMPITLTCKNKELQKTFTDIKQIIEE